VSISVRRLAVVRRANTSAADASMVAVALRHFQVLLVVRWHRKVGKEGMLNE
jgi:hypothetical protein